MQRVLIASLTLAFVVGAIALSGGEQKQKTENGDLQLSVEERNPWTNLRLNDDPATFHFAIVSDRTGGHRARIFSEAVDRLNLMQPSFVVSVGDLIEGYTKDQAQLAKEWKEFQTYVHRLQMPFFYVPGNHDVANLVEAKEWQERFGRRYYHFVYRNVLFLLLNSDDPAEDEAKGKIGKEQLEFIQKALSDNPKVNWTMVFMHKPLWSQEKIETTGWLDVEKALQGRPYTVFVGHVHRYQKFVRQGRNYYQLATTGGGSKVRGVPYGEFDHIVWVTMKKEGPTLANILLDGIYPEDLKVRFSNEEGVNVYNRKPVYPARGQVLFNGAPVPSAWVSLYAVSKDMDPKKLPPRVADAMVDSDGTVVFSTYGAYDGVPAGEYIVTVALNTPRFDETMGKPGPNKLPEKYAAPKTSDLRVEVKAGQANVFSLNLTP